MKEQEDNIIPSWENIEASEKYKSLDYPSRMKVRRGHFDIVSSKNPEYMQADAMKQKEIRDSWMNQEPTPVASPDDPDFIPGVQRGLQNLQSTLYGAGALAGAGMKKIGAEEVGQAVQDFGMEGYRRNVEEAKQYTKKNSFKDVYTGEAGIGGTVDWIQGTLGELVPSMLEAAAGAAIGSAIGSSIPVAGTGVGAITGAFATRTILKKGIEKTVQKALKKGIGNLTESQLRKHVTRQALTKFGGKIGMGAAVMPMESGGTYADLLEEHNVDAPATALLAGALKTSIEYAGGNSKLVDTFVDALSTGAKDIVKKSVKEILTNIPQEAIQEGGQELIDILATVANTDEKLLSWKNVESIVESMGAGAIGGGAGAAVSIGMNTKTDSSNTYEDQLQQRFVNIKSQGTEKIPASISSLTIKVNKNNQLLRDPKILAALAQKSGYEVSDLQTFLTAENKFNQDLVVKLQEELTSQGQDSHIDPITGQDVSGKSMEDIINQYQADNAGPDQSVSLRDTQSNQHPDVMAPDQDVSLTQPNQPGAIDTPFIGNAADNTSMDIEQSMIDTSIDMQRQADMPNAVANAQAESLLHNSVLQKVRTGQEDTFTTDEGVYYDKYVTAMEQQQKLNKRNIAMTKAQEDFANAPGPDLPSDIIESMKAKALSELPVELLTAQNKPYKSRKRLEARIASLPAEAEYVITETADGFIATKKELPDSSASPFINEQQLAEPLQVVDVPSAEQIALNEEQLVTNQQQLDAINTQIVTTTDSNERMALQQQSSALYNENVSLQQQINKQYDAQTQAQGTLAEPSAETARFDTQFQTSEQINDTIAWTPDRLSEELDSAAYADGRTKGFVAWINPIDFVNATTFTDDHRQRIKKDAGDLDINKLREESQTPYLSIDNGEIVNHEGRHRMLAMAEAGITSAPVVLDFGQAKIWHRQEDLKLTGQAFYNYITESNSDKGTDIIVTNVIPLTFDNRKKIQAEMDNASIQFQTSDQAASTQLGLPEIEGMFPGQEVIQDADGTINVRLKNGKGITFKSIQDAGQGFVKLAIETGQMSKQGKILGITVGSDILLDADYADNKTMWHENKHALDNLDMITNADNVALNKEFNKLRKAGKLEFALSTAIDPKTNKPDHVKRMEENRANMFAQIMVNREAYRNTPFGKTIQRIMDFFQQLLAFGNQTISGLSREVESGKIYARKVEKASKTEPMFQFANMSIAQQVLGGLISKKTATNTKAFKSWFGNSVAKTKNGDPVIFYHGTDEVFDEFAKDDQSKSGHLTADLGHFFTMKKGLAEKYGQHQIKAYLKMEKPYRMSLEESQSFDYFGAAEQFKENLQKQGYDSIIVATGTSPYIIVFDSGQAKSIHNQGSWNDNKNIYFETRMQETEQKLSASQYAALRARKKNILQNIVRQAKIKISDTKLLADKALTPISTRLGLIDKELPTQLKAMDFRTTQKIIDVLTPASEMLDIIHGKKNKLGIRQGGIPAADRADWNIARLQADTGKIQQLAQKYGLTEHLNLMREKLNQIRLEAKKVGYDIGFIDDYWPRIINDRDGFLRATEGISQEPVFTQAFRAQAKKLGITQEAFERDFPDVRADIISNIILGHADGIGGPGNIQSRVFETIPDEYVEFYMDADASLMQYVYSMSKKIEARKFFGKVPARISALKSARKRKKTDLIKYQQLADIVQTDNPEAFAQYSEKIDSLKEDIALIEEPLNNYKAQNDFTENIGTYINDLMMEGKIGKQDEKTVKDILNARFNEHGTHGIVNALKNASYIDVMGNPLSAITQIGDLAFAMYVGKVWTPKGFVGTAKNLSNAIKTISDISKEDLGFERIAQEFSDSTTLGKAVSKVFKFVGLERMDSIGKEVLINNALDQYKLQAEKDPQALAETIRPIFKAQTNSVIKELMTYDPTNPNDVPSDNIKLLLYSKVLDFQPVALSEMPEFYLAGGNGRIAYMLKTYTIKQFDVFRREVFHNVKYGTAEQKIQGIKNMVQLTALLTLANASADEIKDFMLGKETRFKDNVIENFLALGGASRYIKMKISRDGLGTALSQQALPPVKFINSISKDAQEGYENYVSGDTGNFEHARIIDSIPGVGKLYYWHYGRGSEVKKTLNEKDFSSEGKRFSKFKKQLEKAPDKRLFLHTNSDEFKQMLLYQNMSKPLNKNKADINALKKLKQTPPVMKRIGQLEKYRKLIYARYFEVAKNLTEQ